MRSASESSGPSVRPSEFVTKEPRLREPSTAKRTRSIATPPAGTPRETSRMCVESRPIRSLYAATDGKQRPCYRQAVLRSARMAACFRPYLGLAYALPLTIQRSRMPLIRDVYGKGRVRVMRVKRDTKRHELRELTVKVM